VNHIVLFICTGNYYRSRFAEALFNHHATVHGVSWQAISRGLAIHLLNEGDLSPFTRKALAEREIGCHHTRTSPRALEWRDLAGANLVIAVDEIEHRPLITEAYPAWQAKIVYWHVRDVAYRMPNQAMSEIERQVLRLISELTFARRLAVQEPSTLFGSEYQSGVSGRSQFVGHRARPRFIAGTASCCS
jgi:protein-tyrosine phosphatase